MPVILTTSRRLPAEGIYDRWCAVADADAKLDSARRVDDLAGLLETAFDSIFEDWAEMARRLGRQPSADLAHMPTCAANISDFGLMLAWSRLVNIWNDEKTKTLVVCDDPWLYRHLIDCGILQAAPVPPLFFKKVRLGIRGILARTKTALKLAMTSLALKHHRDAPKTGVSVLLVYGHPVSTVDGMDGYFADLMNKIPGLVRMLHVDAPLAKARQLAGSGRTQSLHAWGSPSFALTLPFMRWKPDAGGKHAWLIRRAAALEGATGQPAMICWQIHCQSRWLRRVKPAVVVWPWENHSWERAFVRSARREGVATIGYQHATVARREWNYSPRSNFDGSESLPDRVFCVGKMERQRLMNLGHEAADLFVGGALRFAESSMPAHAKGAPIFVALPSDRKVAAQMMSAVSRCASTGYSFLVKDHPMSPFSFEEAGYVTRSRTPLQSQTVVSAVFFAATTVGLEAAIAGLPVIRFLPEDRVLSDPLPEQLSATTATLEGLTEALIRAAPSQGMAREDVFATPNEELWQGALYKM